MPQKSSAGIDRTVCRFFSSVKGCTCFEVAAATSMKVWVHEPRAMQDFLCTENVMKHSYNASTRGGKLSQTHTAFPALSLTEASGVVPRALNTYMNLLKRYAR